MASQPVPFGKLLFSFEGRINRAKYWLYGFLFLIVIYGLLMGLGYLVFGSTGLVVAYVIGFLAIIWPSFALSIKRCHDRGRSGYFILVGLIPIVDIWYIAEVCFMRGTIGPNKYGEDPLAPEIPNP